MKCIKSHLHKIDVGLVPSRKCTEYELHHYCYYYGDHESKKIDDPLAIEPPAHSDEGVSTNSVLRGARRHHDRASCHSLVNDLCGQHRGNSNPQCLKCIQKHYKSDLMFKCHLRFLHHYCD